MTRRSINPNLFLQTRALTASREDHLTYFLAAALEVDEAFREAYELGVLSSLETIGARPRIARIETQAIYHKESCRPDLRLQLADGRMVLCEHKLEAPETLGESDDGESIGQLRRYLELPIDAVAYFRTTLKPPAQEILAHHKYLKPVSAPHFLWQDLYEPLSHGTHILTTWLRDGFDKLGFTPPLPHIGKLWPEDSDDVKRNQENFGKLWNKTIASASTHWEVGLNRRCGIFLRPRSPLTATSRVTLWPGVQGGTILCTRVKTSASQADALRYLVEGAARDLPIEPEIVNYEVEQGVWSIDLLTPLHEVLGDSADPRQQEDRLFRQVSPILAALISTV